MATWILLFVFPLEAAERATSLKAILHTLGRRAPKRDGYLVLFYRDIAPSKPE